MGGDDANGHAPTWWCTIDPGAGQSSSTSRMCVAPTTQTGNSHASGVFQILYPSTWDGTSYAAQSPFDYNANIHAAFEIFSRDGYSWREWECKPY